MTITAEQANSIQARCDTVRAFLGKRTSYKSEEVAHLNPPTNEEISSLEVYLLNTEQPESFTAYVPWESLATPEGKRNVTTWTGERVAIVVSYGDWHRNNFGGKWRQVTIKPDFCRWYYTGREYDSRQCVNFRRMKAAF